MDDPIEYAIRYGGRCRECADSAIWGVCDTNGAPCDPAVFRAAINHALKAWTYGIAHGFTTNPLPDATQSARIAELESERDAAFAMSNCECGADEACRNLVAAEARATAAEERLKEATDAIRNLMGIYDTPLSRRRFPPDGFMKEALEIARAFLEKESADEPS